MDIGLPIEGLSGLRRRYASPTDEDESSENDSALDERELQVQADADAIDGGYPRDCPSCGKTLYSEYGEYGHRTHCTGGPVTDGGDGDE